MAFGLRRKAIHQIDYDEPAKNWRQDDPVPEPAWPLEDVGVVGDLEDAVDHEIVDQADERSKQHRADAGHDADAERHKAEGEQAHTPLVAGGGGWGRRDGGVGGR